jgi:hypothetical protein
VFEIQDSILPVIHRLVLVQLDLVPGVQGVASRHGLRHSHGRDSKSCSEDEELHFDLVEGWKDERRRQRVMMVRNF